MADEPVVRVSRSEPLYIQRPGVRVDVKPERVTLHQALRFGVFAGFAFGVLLAMMLFWPMVKHCA